jgi:hypothetical protein
MLINIQVSPGSQFRRSYVIQEDERAHHPFFAGGEDPTHQEIADIPASFRDYRICD